MHCVRHAPTFLTFDDALTEHSNDHSETIRTIKSGDWHNDRRDEAATITYGIKEVEEAFINFAPYMDAGCMTARPQTPAKRLAALFRRVGLSHLCITDKDNIFRGLITRRSLITVQQAAEEHDEQAAHGGGGGHGAPAAAAADAAAGPSQATMQSRKVLQGSRVQSIAEEVEEGKQQQ